jgi:group I intron endonuclease
MASGIYSITINQYVYYGSAKNIKQRWRLHISNLKLNKHSNAFMQNLFNKYGLNALVFSIVEECTVIDLLNREQQYLDKLFNDPKMHPINVMRIANSHLGLKRKESTKAKMRKPKSFAHKQALSAANSGKQPSINTIEANKKNYRFINPMGQIIEVRGLSSFCDVHGLDKATMSRLYYGKRGTKSHKGYTRYTGDDS